MADPDLALLRLSERDWAMWSLFIKGYSPREISEKYDLDPADVKHVLALVRKSFRPEDLDHVRMTHLEELREASKMMWQLAEKDGTPVTSGKDGRVVVDPDSGEIVRDYTLKISAVGMIVKLQERASKLIGLDAPVKVSATVRSESIDDNLLELARQLGVTLDAEDTAALEATAERLDGGGSGGE